MSFGTNIIKLRENPNFANAGKIWSKDETRELLSKLFKNQDLESIALEHKISINSIKLKILDCAFNALLEKQLMMYVKYLNLKRRNF